MRTKPTDYYPRVWILNIEGDVFHNQVRIRWQDLPPEMRRDEWITTTCRSHDHRVKRSWAAGVTDLPISWAVDLGFRPCRKCRWDRWVLAKYGATS